VRRSHVLGEGDLAGEARVVVPRVFQQHGIGELRASCDAPKSRRKGIGTDMDEPPSFAMLNPTRQP
jgi:hypothetical protein